MDFIIQTDSVKYMNDTIELLLSGTKSIEWQFGHQVWLVSSAKGARKNLFLILVWKQKQYACTTETTGSQGRRSLSCTVAASIFLLLL